MSVLDLLMAKPWIMEPESLQGLVEIAERHASGIKVEWEALTRKQGELLNENSRVTVSGGIATVPLTGPIFPRANLMTNMSGATSAEMFMRDVSAAEASKQVRGIVISVDSPGGAVHGIDEASELVYSVRQHSRKPIYAHVSGNCCSAAYWIASATEGIFATPTSTVGSIGVVYSAVKDDQSGKVVITSKNAPNKRLDPESKEGRQAIQEQADAIEEVFIETIARNRGITTDAVIKNYGRGGVFVGKSALESGLIDGIATQDDLTSFVRALS